MTKPTTPTGRRQHWLAWCDPPVSFDAIGGQHGHNKPGPEGCDDCEIISAIEQEAAAAERERLRAKAETVVLRDRSSFALRMAAAEMLERVLADPEPDE